MKRSKRFSGTGHPFLFALSALGVLMVSGVAHAKPGTVKATYSAANHALTVSVKATEAEVVVYDDVLDQEIARGAPGTFSLNRLPVVPCRVRVESGGNGVVAAVAGADCKGALQPPTCKITQPVGHQKIANNGSLSFRGEVKGAKSRTLRYEWDFGGGADARPLTATTGDIAFTLARDTTLWVSFSASDLSGARCADRMQVTVGNPPTNLPPKVPEQKAMQGDPNYVVMPFQPYGMEFHDLTYANYSNLTPSNRLNASVMKKGRKPAYLTPQEVDVKYSAASSATDPAGSGSINSTSQNYPLGATYGQARVKKSDWFDPCMVWQDTNPATKGRDAGDTQFQSFFDTYIKQSSPNQGRNPQPRPGTNVSGNMTNAECAFANFYFPAWYGHLPAFDPANPKTFAYMNLSPDEGAANWTYDLIARFDPIPPKKVGFLGFLGVMKPNGAALPGRDDPYKANAPQAFASATQPRTASTHQGYDPERKFFAAVGLPNVPVDDKGRHNAYPLMRVQARDKAGKLLGTTDAVTAVTTEMKCAECHTKGKNGADQAVYDGLLADMGWSFDKTNGFKAISGRAAKAGLEKYAGREKWIPQFVAPEDVDPVRKDERDVIEQASMINIARLHDFYYNFIEESGWLGPLELEGEALFNQKSGETNQVKAQPGNCVDYCHKSVPRADARRYNMSPANDIGSACPEMSDSLHNIHGRLTGTLNADYTGTIDRDPLNRELKLVDLTNADPANPPNYLLKVKDAGTPDDSCYFCHAGRQDKYQRDVMTTAGVNCIDCHGDLAVLAGGGAMVSRGKGNQDLLLDSRVDQATKDKVLNATVDKDKLAYAYSAQQSSYGEKADGTWFYMEKGADGLYRNKEGAVVTTLTMALNFLSGTTGVDNGSGTYTLTKKEVVTTVTEAELLDQVKVKVNEWNLHFARIPWAEQLSCANCHSGEGDEPVKRRAYDMTTGKFRLLPVSNERFAENLQPKQHDSSYVLEVQNGQNCPPGTFSDSVTNGGKHVCERGLFKDSLDKHGAVACETCHGPTHGIWPNPNPYANDNVTALQLQGHTGTILDCNVCHTPEDFKDGKMGSLRYGEGVLAGPHNMHPVNDPYWWKSASGDAMKGGWHNDWAKKKGPKGEDQCATCHGKDHLGTRLSKVPVDRTFTDGKGKPVKVKAGTPVGCDLCHSVEQSFKK